MEQTSRGNVEVEGYWRRSKYGKPVFVTGYSQERVLVRDSSSPVGTADNVNTLKNNNLSNNKVVGNKGQFPGGRYMPMNAQSRQALLRSTANEVERLRRQVQAVGSPTQKLDVPSTSAYEEVASPGADKGRDAAHKILRTVGASSAAVSRAKNFLAEDKRAQKRMQDQRRNPEPVADGPGSSLIHFAEGDTSQKLQIARNALGHSNDLFSVEVTSSEDSHSVAIDRGEFEGVFRDSKGAVIADFVQEIDPVSKRMYYKQLNIHDNSVEKQGLVENYRRSMEPRLRSMGVESVAADASGAASFGLARAGYDWNREAYDSAEDLASDVQNTLHSVDSDIQNHDYEKMAKRQVKELQKKLDLFASTHNMEDMPTPFEISQVGYTANSKDWAGKSGMMKKGWSARKDLR